jgi:sporulation protein YlmC with PRC-barrel domain
MRTEREANVLRRLRDYDGFEVWSREGRDLGRVEDFYFDDDRWAVRYIVVRTGSWFTGRSVLLSPISIAGLDWDRARIDFKLTEEQITGAPDADLAQPISRRYETEYAGYYGIPHYWGGSDLWGMWSTPMEVQPPTAMEEPLSEQELLEAQHVRSMREVTGYHILATDGEIGHVEDFLVDGASWRIRYLMIDTSNWMGGRTVLLAPEWASRIEWVDQKVHVDVTRAEVEQSPEYDPAADIDGQYEERLAESYKRRAARPARPASR